MKGKKSEQKNYLKNPRRLVEKKSNLFEISRRLVKISRRLVKKRSWIILWQQGGTSPFPPILPTQTETFST